MRVSTAQTLPFDPIFWGDEMFSFSVQTCSHTYFDGMHRSIFQCYIYSYYIIIYLKNQIYSILSIDIQCVLTDSRDIRTWSILLQFESTRQKVGWLTFNAGERSRRYLARYPDAPCIWLLDKNGYLAAKDSIRFSWICIWIIKVRQNWGDSPANTGVLPLTMRGFKMAMMELQTMLGKHWIADMGLSRNVCFNRPIIKKNGW